MGKTWWRKGKSLVVSRRIVPAKKEIKKKATNSKSDPQRRPERPGKKKQEQAEKKPG